MKFLLILLFCLTSCTTPLLDNVAVSKISQPSLKPIKIEGVNDFNYKQIGRWGFQFEIDKVKYRGYVPSGWISDGTSIPRAVWSVSGIERDGLERGASWQHDWEYVHNGNILLEEYNGSNWVKSTKILSREEVDNIFYRGLIKLEVDPKQAKLMFDMVRKFGYSVWQRHTL